MKKYLLAAAAVGALSVSAHANLIGVGPGEFSPDVFSGFPSGSIVASIIDAPYVSLLGASDFSGSYSTWVIKTGSGTLDFVYAFDSNSTSKENVDRVTVSDFSGFSTDVGYAAIGGDIAPTQVDRTAAATVGYNISVPESRFSDWLIVDTNATHWTDGHVSFINSGVSLNDAFAPTVPELPTWAMGLVGFALLGFLGSTRVRKTRRAAFAD